MTKTVYIDLDGVIVDIEAYIKSKYVESYVDSMGIGYICDQDLEMFYNAPPIDGSIEAFKQLSQRKDLEIYILSTAPWANPESWKAKRVWVEKNLGFAACKRLILSHRKDLLKGDVLIDDRDNNGAAQFEGTHIKFGTKPFDSWKEVLEYLTENS